MNILIDFHLDGQLYASKSLPVVPRVGEYLIFKKVMYRVTSVNWMFEIHPGIENYVNITMEKVGE